MKLYTEEQVRKAIKMASSPNIFQNPFLFGKIEILEKLTPIELPSDEEIEEEILAKIEGELIGFPGSFRKGAKWMRDKIGGNK